MKRGLPWLWLVVAAIVAAVASCSKREVPAAEAEAPGGWAVLEHGGGSRTYVIPHKLSDGTRCVIVVGSLNSGRGISCDWGPR